MLSERIYQPLYDRLRRNDEGNIPWMYPDTEGNVTVGIGTELPTARSATEVAFYVQAAPGKPKRDATAAEITAAWEVVKAAKFPHKNYAEWTQLRIDQPEIDRLVKKDIGRFEGDLRKLYRRFDLFPDEAKIALFDMIYNLGYPHLRNFPKFNKELNALKPDWNKIADESHWKCDDPSRPLWVRSRFKLCAQRYPLKAPEHVAR